ncbi:MAG: hypothetical protein HW418_2091 [Anaerolineales bacterium]|nr:hypothetical protein [Anaerolineales bacterium]
MVELSVAVRTRFAVACLVLWLVGCRSAANGTVTTAPALQPALLPTPTALADGLIVRLGTPDPSPNCPEHYPWFFDNQAQECATTLLNTWGVVEHFEHGLMLWFQEGGRTYVLL